MQLDGRSIALESGRYMETVGTSAWILAQYQGRLADPPLLLGWLSELNSQCKHAQRAH